MTEISKNNPAVQAQHSATPSTAPHPYVSMIAAIQKGDRGLGFHNDLLVRISTDLKRFKALTVGHPVVMGRKTFESIRRPLSDRTNIVVTSNISFHPDGVIVKHSLEQALEKAKEIACHGVCTPETVNDGHAEIFIIGGAEIYKQALPHADRLYLTIVESDKPADVFFPEYETLFTKIVAEEKHVDEVTGLHYSYVTLER